MTRKLFFRRETLRLNIFIACNLYFSRVVFKGHFARSPNYFPDYCCVSVSCKLGKPILAALFLKPCMLFEEAN